MVERTALLSSFIASTVSGYSAQTQNPSFLDKQDQNNTHNQETHKHEHRAQIKHHLSV